MKHLDEVHSAYLAELLASGGIEVEPRRQDLMLAHLDWVLDWNDKINLTAITNPREAVRLHLFDSLTAFQLVSSCPPGRMCDLGSGAGFPGIPLALATGRQTILVESVKKKAKVVSDFVASRKDALANVSVIPLRAEEYALTSGGQASVVTARALSQLGALIELASPLLAASGALIALKGAMSASELLTAEGVARKTGMRIERIVEIALPESGEARSLVMVRKCSKSTVKLPRRPGQAQRDPL